MESVAAASVTNNLTSPPTVTGGGDSWFWFFIQIVVWSGIFYLIVFSANLSEVSKNWPKYRCNPTVIPFADMYGYNSLDNFNYCMRNIFKNEVGAFTNPFASILGTMMGTFMSFLQNINSFRIMLATLLSGISRVFQEFIDRFKFLFMQIRTTSVRIQFLMRRVFATFIAVIYMGSSAMTAGLNFGDTFLFRFLDTFCFHPETLVTIQGRGTIPICDVQLGDRFVKTGAVVTAKYAFVADGQPMILLPRGSDGKYIEVSTNHYIMSGKGWIRAEEHPLRQPSNPWSGGVNKPLICLDTDIHVIPIDDYIFSDYMETNASDKETMQTIDTMLNGKNASKPPLNISNEFAYEPCFDPITPILLNDSKSITLEEISLGQSVLDTSVYGIVERLVTETVIVDGLHCSPSQLIWDVESNCWLRAGTFITSTQHKKPVRMKGIFTKQPFFRVLHGMVLRDAMEVQDPCVETVTTKVLCPEK